MHRFCSLLAFANNDIYHPFIIEENISLILLNDRKQRSSCSVYCKYIFFLIHSYLLHCSSFATCSAACRSAVFRRQPLSVVASLTHHESVNTIDAIVISTTTFTVKTGSASVITHRQVCTIGNS